MSQVRWKFISVSACDFLFVVGASQPPERDLSGDLARPKSMHIHLISLVYDPKQSARRSESTKLTNGFELGAGSRVWAKALPISTISK